MQRNHELAEKIHEQLNTASKILVVSHIRPDGDAIGSLLAVGMSLLNSGKDVQMVLSDGVPDNFKFLAGSELIRTKPVGNFDYIIVVDSGDLERTDTALVSFGTPDLNIDHHITNTNFAKINLVDSHAVATSEILVKYLPKFGMKINREIADALLTGIITDTIGFRTSNMHPEVLDKSAELMRLGADLVDIYQRTINAQTYEAAKYWGAGLTKLQMEDGLVWTTLTLEDRKIAGYNSKDDADLIKILSAIDGAKIAVILTEQSEGYVKISWRLCGSLPSELDVSQIALKFGGGGHKAAAGADVKGKLDIVLEEVLNTTRISMDQSEKPEVKIR